MNKPLISIDELKRMLSYDPQTGLFRWAISPNQRHKVGSVAGCFGHNKGHVCIIIHGKKYKAHRLAWLYHYGQWPDGQVDHRDLDGANNRIDNLREATNGQNCANRRPFGKTGLKGVVLMKRGRKPWRAQMSHNKKKILIGYFGSAEEAQSAYAAAAQAAHGEFARTS